MRQKDMKYLKTWCFDWTMGDVLNAFLLVEPLHNILEVHFHKKWESVLANPDD